MKWKAFILAVVLALLLITSIVVYSATTISPDVYYDWISGIPAQTDNDTFEWVGGKSFVRLYVVVVSAPTVTNDGGASLITHNSARLNGEVTATGNQNPTTIVFWGQTDGGTTPVNWSNNATIGTTALGTFLYDAGGLSPLTLYYYRMYASNSGGSDWADSSANFTTTLDPPTDFVLTDLGAITINAAWTTADGANYTMVRISRTDYPTRTTEGELFCYTDGTTANSTGYGLDITTYFASAFSFLSDNITYSADYATASIGGEGMTEVADSISEMTTQFAAILAGNQTMFASAILLVVMLFIAALAYWHKDRVLLVLSGFGFIVYGFTLWDDAWWLSFITVLAGMYLVIKAFAPKRLTE